jgi:hypothetical protein
MGRLIAWVLPIVMAAAVQAQVAVLPVQALRFGEVTSAVKAAVSPTDAASRLEVHLLGSGEITVVFDLPGSLSSADGRALHLRFGPGDGLVALGGSTALVPFDPSMPLSLYIPAASGGARIYLGGTAIAPRDQPPGNYSAPITVRVIAR